MKLVGRVLVVMAVSLFVFSGCAALREVAALRRVDFSIDRLSDPALAGVSLKNVKSYKDIGLLDAGRLALALADRDLPLTFVLHVKAVNPADNPVAARLMGMDWVLFVKDKETLRGTLDQSVSLLPGEAQDVPLVIGFNLLEFFDDGIKEMVNLASSLEKKEEVGKRIRLQVTPTIDTSLGPIRYPQPITVISR